MIASAVTLWGCGGNDSNASGNEEDSGESVLAHNIEAEDPYAVPEVTDPIMSYAVNECVTLGNIDDMTVTLENDYTLTDEIVHNNIESLLAYQAIYEVTDKQVVETGDIVNIDYVGKKDGVAFNGGTATGYRLTIGSGQFIPGFEDGLIGVRVGDTVDLDLTFPENYGSEELAGAAVVFTVTVNSIDKQISMTYDELTDEFVSENFGMATVSELEENVRERLVEMGEEQKQTEIEDLVTEKVISEAEINIPDGLVDQLCDQWVGILQNRNELDDFESYVEGNYQLTMDEFYTQLREEVVENTKKQLVFEAVADKLKVTVSDEELDEYIDSIVSAGTYGYSSEEVVYKYSSKYQTGRDYLRQRYKMEKTIDELAKTVKVEEKKS